MARSFLVLCLSVVCLCSVSATHEGFFFPHSPRRLLAPAPAAPSTSKTASSPGSTCCNCKCVIPAKDMRSPECKAKPNGCVGLGAPTYGKKNICVSGANKNCDNVCIRDMGSWKAYYEC